jgi:two-component system OmpR family sensor kinase
MKLFNSIRWRLQIWHGAVLLIVLTAFGFTAYQLAFENRFRMIDRDLQKATDRLFQACAPMGDAGKGKSPPDFSKTPVEMLAMMNIPEPDDTYYAFLVNGAKLRASKNAPDEIPPPLSPSDGASIRMRGVLREQVLSRSPNMSLVIGRSVATDLDDLHRLAWIMGLVGAAVAAFGLIGGWWIANGTIRPIKDISATASKIAEDNLAERIRIPNAGNELGQLAQTLNSTFDRLHAAYEQLQRALKRQTDFTADASHELRTPVSVILAETTSTLSRDRTGEEYKESMESIQRSARRMRQLTESLLALARLDSAHSSEHVRCDVKTITNEIVESLRPLAEQHKVNLSQDLSPMQMNANPEQIGQVIENLLSNAIHYNRPGGSSRIKVAMENGTPTIIVSDDGPGIPEQDLPHIFDRFYRADKSRSQSNGRVGLGLAITKAIVDAHKGSISVSSQPGKGSTFTVRFASGD